MADANSLAGSSGGGAKVGFLVLGNQLFPMDPHLDGYADAQFFMAEDRQLCTYVQHHKQKLVLFLSAMRHYRDELERQGFAVTYHSLEQAEADGLETYEARLGAFCDEHAIDTLVSWEIEDKFFEERVRDFCQARDIAWTVRESPMFLTSRADGAAFLEGHEPHMATFYRQQRKRLKLLVDGAGKPKGGKWSFDADNREALPKDVVLAPPEPAATTDHVRSTARLVQAQFPDHPGELDLERWWMPVTRRDAKRWLEEFLRDRFAQFGPYEDALSTRDPFLFHSVLTPALNLGLLTPDEVVQGAVAAAKSNSNVPLSSLEGFVRQVIGWREFIRLIYRAHSERQETRNFFDHKRKLTAAWWTGETGLPPLDDVIRKAQRYGFAHHIERLMVVGNLMTLCEIDPTEAHRWFMEMFVDSSDWVMGPNVYGMALFADGGLFATKPYICGSNYLLKMSDYAKPKAGKSGEPTWADTIDGLYWRFIDTNREFFSEQARLSYAVRTLERMGDARRERILAAAERFLETFTA